MNTLKEILLNGGYVTSAAHAELKDVFPNLAVCVKWGQSLRQPTTLGKLDAVLNAGEARGDYVREVFVPVGPLDQLREALGITEDDQRSYYQELEMQQNLSGLS